MEAGEGGLRLGVYRSDGKRKSLEQTDETADFYRFNFDALGGGNPIGGSPAATKMADPSREKGSVVAGEQTRRVMMRE